MSSITRTLPIPSDQQINAPKLLTPLTLPIPLLSLPIVRPYSIAHTVGVSLYYYLRASSLVADPLATLLQDIIPIAVLQALFCIICLPSAGNWNSGTTSEASRTSKGDGINKTPSRKKGGSSNSGHRATGGTLQNRIMIIVFSLILALAVPPMPLTTLALVLGAPLYPTSLLPHTFALSLHVSLLGFLPLFYTHGVSADAWRDVAAAWLPFDEAGVWAGTVGCMVGGWIGAIPIALDWDREWQKWPCTVIWGVTLGWAVGRLLSSTLKLGVGKRIDLSEGKRIVLPGVRADSATGLVRKQK